MTTGEGTKVTSLLTEDLTYRKIDYWCRSGYVPGVPSLGSGVARELTPEQVRTVRLLHRLTMIGLSPSAASHAVETAFRLGTTLVMLVGPGLTLTVTDLS